MRAELARPGLQFLSPEQYNQLFTMHGTIMLLLFATPLFFGFANVIMPLQIGAPDVAFPRLNMFSYWLFLFGGLIAVLRLPHPAGRGRLRLVRLHAAVRRGAHRPASAATCGSSGLAMAGLGTILGAVNFITTIICMRAPGMTMFRMPIFTWNILVTSAAGADRVPDPGRRAARAGGRPASSAPTSSTRANGGADAVAAPVLVLRPPRGLHHRAAVLRHHHRDPPGVQPQADLRLQGPGRRDDRASRVLSVAVWAHHMFVTGAVLLPFFSVHDAS